MLIQFQTQQSQWLSFPAELEKGQIQLFIAQSLNVWKRCLAGAVWSFCEGDQILASLDFSAICKTWSVFSEVWTKAQICLEGLQTDLDWFLFCLKLCLKLWLSKVFTKPSVQFDGVVSFFQHDKSYCIHSTKGGWCEQASPSILRWAKKEEGKTTKYNTALSSGVKKWHSKTALHTFLLINIPI